METRSAEKVREHYEIEKEIAQRLLNSTPDERSTLYTWAYDELFQNVPHHPLLSDVPQAERRKYVAKEVQKLSPFVNDQTVYLEIGPGDCLVALEMAKQAKKVYAIDVTNEITKSLNAPENFELIISNGTSIPVSPEEVDFVYSDQLMEHLHPEDSLKQLRSIYKALKPGGKYFCITPNRLSGPHDISRNFDPVATGLHLKEYTVTELSEMFKETGFTTTKVYLQFSGYKVFLPVFLYKISEGILSILPHSLRKMITFNKVVRFLLGIKLIGEK